MADTQHLRQRAKEQVDALSPSRLQVAADFLDDLSTREEDAATEELLALPELKKQLEQAEADLAAGRGTPWREMRDGV